jgi:hypothetical protein
MANRLSVLKKAQFMAITLGTLVLTAQASIAGETKGTISYPKGTVTVKYSYLVKGPDAFDSKKMIRRLIFSATDLTAKLAACKAMSCSDGEVTEGMTVDLDAGPRLNYWMVMNGGLVQYSGTKEPTALKTSADDAKHLAGKLSFDDAGAGGPKVDVDFDAALVKEFTQAR